MAMTVTLCSRMQSVVNGKKAAADPTNEKFSEIVKIFCVFLHKTYGTLYIFALRIRSLVYRKGTSLNKCFFILLYL